MPGSSHHGLSPRASNTNRGAHPDLDEFGNVRWEAFLPPDRRAFMELRRDPVRWQAFYAGLTERQRREHPDVQAWVAGETYAPHGDTLDGLREYQADLAKAREVYGVDKELTSYDVQAMSLEEYDKAFDAHGRPREGYSFRRTDRDIIADDQNVDRFSRSENERRARDRR
jgi:hypothetical protein